MNLKTIKTELKEHLNDYILNSFKWSDIVEDAYELHFQAFNQDRYIIGYYQAEQWLKKHNISVFEAIQFCQDYEIEQFGEYYKRYDNAESLVNMMTCIIGEELANELV